MITVVTKVIPAMLLLIAADVDAHSKMNKPDPLFTDRGKSMNPTAVIEPKGVLPVPSGYTYNSDSPANLKGFLAAWNGQTKWKTLRDFLYDAQEVTEKDPRTTKECGITLLDGPKQRLPDKEIEWMSFSHVGPCEMWCDDVRIAQADNCDQAFPGSRGIIPYDKTKCSGAKVLQGVWLAIHQTPWQVIMNCVALEGADGVPAVPGRRGSGNNSTVSTQSEATKAPKSTTNSVPPPSTLPSPKTGGNKCVRKAKRS